MRRRGLFSCRDSAPDYHLLPPITTGYHLLPPICGAICAIVQSARCADATSTRTRYHERGPRICRGLRGSLPHAVEDSELPQRNPRRSYKRDVLWKRVKAMGMPCHICGMPIDPELPAGHPLSFELDEIVPVSKGGRADVMENVASSHRCCNQWRGNKPMSRVNAIKGEAARRFGAWRSPLEFVQRARAAAKGAKAPEPIRRPDGLPTSREW